MVQKTGRPLQEEEAEAREEGEAEPMEVDNPSKYAHPYTYRFPCFYRADRECMILVLESLHKIHHTKCQMTSQHLLHQHNFEMGTGLEVPNNNRSYLP